MRRRWATRMSNFHSLLIEKPTVYRPVRFSYRFLMLDMVPGISLIHSVLSSRSPPTSRTLRRSWSVTRRQQVQFSLLRICRASLSSLAPVPALCLTYAVGYIYAKRSGRFSEEGASNQGAFLERPNTLASHTEGTRHPSFSAMNWRGRREATHEHAVL